MTTEPRNAPRFRRLIEKWCQRTGVSYSDLARRIGLDPSTLSLIMGGQRGLTMPNALALHRETGIAVEKLLTPSDLQLLRQFMNEADRPDKELSCK